MSTSEVDSRNIAISMRKSVENLVISSQDAIGQSISHALSFSGVLAHHNQVIHDNKSVSRSPSPSLRHTDSASDILDNDKISENSLQVPGGGPGGDLAAALDVPILRPDKQATTPRGADGGSGRSKKKSWYNALYPTYKSKSDDFKRLFKDLPDDERLIVDYSCALQKDILVHGRLYASQHYLCFYASIFGWETCLTLRWKDVTAITKEKTALVIPNAILVCTEGEKHFLTSFSGRDKAYLMLFRVWQNALMDQPMTSQEIWQWVHTCYGDELGFNSDDEGYARDFGDEPAGLPPADTSEVRGDRLVIDGGEWRRGRRTRRAAAARREGHAPTRDQRRRARRGGRRGRGRRRGGRGRAAHRHVRHQRQRARQAPQRRRGGGVHQQPHGQAAAAQAVPLQHRPDVHHDLHQLQVQPGAAGRARHHRLRAGAVAAAERAQVPPDQLHAGPDVGPHRAQGGARHRSAGDEQVLEGGRAVLHRRDQRERGHPVRGLLQRGGALLPAARRRPHRAGAVRARQVQEDHVAHDQGVPGEEHAVGAGGVRAAAGGAAGGRGAARPFRRARAPPPPPRRVRGAGAGRGAGGRAGGGRRPPRAHRARPAGRRAGAAAAAAAGAAQRPALLAAVRRGHAEHRRPRPSSQSHVGGHGRRGGAVGGAAGAARAAPARPAGGLARRAARHGGAPRADGAGAQQAAGDHQAGAGEERGPRGGAGGGGGAARRAVSGCRMT